MPKPSEEIREIMHELLEKKEIIDEVPQKFLGVLAQAIIIYLDRKNEN